MKTIWDEKIVKWQRLHVGCRLPKSEFSKLIGETWTSISTEVLCNGFRKAGIFPFNDSVIPESQYDPAALQRWKRRGECQKELGQAGVEIEDVAQQNISAQDQNPPENEKCTFESLLLSTVKQAVPFLKRKKSRVAAGAEVITTEEMLEKLQEAELEPKRISKKPRTRKVDRNVSTARGTPAHEDSIQLEPVHGAAEKPEETQDEEKDLAEGKWVLVKYSSKRSVLFYVGIVISKNHSIGQADWNVKFVKFKDDHFFWPELEDFDTVSQEDVVKMLPEPALDRRGNSMTFSINLSEFKLA
jgi:hypothetical protein